MPTVVETSNVFHPADYSLPELRFLLEHLEESPTVALDGGQPVKTPRDRSVNLKVGEHVINPVQVRPLLQRMYELEELRRVRQKPWAGYDPIRESIERFIAFQENCIEWQKQGHPRHPSMHTWDSTGERYKGGIGSDPSDRIRHEILPNGERRPFEVHLLQSEQSKTKLPWLSKDAPVNTDRIIHENGIMHCTICDKPITSYDVALGRKAANKARAAARKHCKTAKNEIARHRTLFNIPIP